MTDAAAAPNRVPPRERRPIAGVECGTPAQAQKGGHAPSLCFFRPVAATALLARRRRGLSPRRRRYLPGDAALTSSEPIFNVPPVVIATVAVLVLVHALRTFALTDEEDVQFLLTFAFIPARYGSDARSRFSARRFRR